VCGDLSDAFQDLLGIRKRAAAVFELACIAGTLSIERLLNSELVDFDCLSSNTRGEDRCLSLWLPKWLDR